MMECRNRHFNKILISFFVIFKSTNQKYNGNFVSKISSNFDDGNTDLVWRMQLMIIKG